MSEVKRFEKYLGALQTQGLSEGTFVAKLTTFENKDMVNDVIKAGALDEWLKNATEIPMLYGHDSKEYIGKWTDFEIKDGALYATGHLFDYIQRAKEVGEHIKRENITGVSIGFTSKQYEGRGDADGYGFDFYKIELYEASVVLNPANEQARITAKDRDFRTNYKRRHIMPTDEKTEGVLTSADFNKATAEMTQALEGKASQKDLESIQKAMNESLEKAFTKANATSEGQIAELRKEFDAEIVKAQAAVRAQPAYETPTWRKSETNPRVAEFDFTYGSKITPAQRDFVKAITTNDQTPGYRVDTIAPFVEMEEANPLRGYQTNIPVDGGSFKVPEVGNLSFVKEATFNQNRSDNATISSKDVNIETYALEIAVPQPADQDVTGLRNSIQQSFTYAGGKSHAENAVGSLIAGVHPASGTAPITNVTTGVAATLPTDGNLIAKATAVTQAIPTSYRAGSIFVMSKPVEARLQALEKSDGAGFAFNPALGVNTLLGYPVVVTDYLEDGATANDVSLVFGNIRMGLICGDSEMFYMAEYMETKPGAITYYARMRYAYTLWDTTGLAGWITKT